VLGRPSSYNIEGVFIIAATSSVAGPDWESGSGSRKTKMPTVDLGRNSVISALFFYPKS
jgi:hypothetical protein